LPNWPVQRLLLARPALRERPVVLHENARGAARVVACSAEAARAGIDAGMTLAEASVLVDEALLHVEPHDPTADRRALETLAAECEPFSPTVGLESTDRPECLFLEATSVSRLFGGEAALVERIADDLARRGLRFQIAMADTLGAAWACCGAIASRNRATKAATTIIPPGKTAEALAPLPVEALRLPPSVVGLLGALGIDRIGPLMGLPRDELASRFGPELLRRLHQTLGQIDEPIRSHRPEAAVAAEHVFEHPTAHRAALENNLRRLIDQVAAEVASRRHGITRLVCELVFERIESASLARAKAVGPLRLEVGLYRASTSAKDIFELATMQLERHWLTSPVATIRVAAVETVPLEYRQTELFTDSAHQDARRLAQLIDRLSGRLGRAAVLGARLAADSQPELAYGYRPLVDGPVKQRNASATAAAAADRALPPRPFLLLPRPVALRPTPSGPNGLPGHVEDRGHVHRVVRALGPERIETGWWRGQSIGRDYYRVETSRGHWLWLFRRLRDGQWFLHGRFQ